MPDASLAVIVASTASTRQRIQRLGRVLRPAPGKSARRDLTIYASEPEAERLASEEEASKGSRCRQVAVLHGEGGDDGSGFFNQVWFDSVRSESWYEADYENSGPEYAEILFPQWIPVV